MPKVCPCGNTIPSTIRIGSRTHNLCNRKFCFTCSPFLAHNTRDLTKPRPIRAERFWRYQSKKRSERKAELVALLGGKCAVCGYSKCLAALEFHHRDPKTKTFSLEKGRLLQRWEIVLAEAQKCDLLCANCHREIEEKLRLDEEAAR